MTSLSNPCLMTGVTMVFQLRDEAVHGDLFLQGDQFIFNSVVDSGTDPAKFLKLPSKQLPGRHIELGLGCHYWERRGVFVIPLASLTFSKEAIAYILPALADSSYAVNMAKGRIKLLQNEG